MKKTLFLWIISFAWIPTANAQNIYICKQVQVSFFSSAPIEDIEAATENGVSAMNRQTGEIYFKIPIRSFEFPNGLMQEHFNENFLESDKFPYSTFKGRVLSPAELTTNGRYDATVEGELSIHGITKPYRETGTIEVEDGQIRLRAKFKVRLADHRISIPKILFRNIAEVVTVSVAAKYFPESAESLN